MGEIRRREFMKIAGVGIGAMAASGLFHDRLLAGTIAPPAAALFEERFGVTRRDMQKVLAAALSKGGDFAELFFEYKLANSVLMEDDIVKESSEAVVLGVGVRVLCGMQTGFGYSSDLSPAKMSGAALTAAAIASSGGRFTAAALASVKPDKQVYQMARPVAEAQLADKIALVKEAYASAFAYDKRITKVSASLADELQVVTIANSEGLLVSDARPQVRLRVSATAEENGVRNTGYRTAGGRVGMAFFQAEETSPKEVGKKAAWEAVTLLSAVNAVPGEQPVVLGKDESGVMVHEAVGHPLEADGNWKKSSIMWDKLGQMVASPLVTISDDATIPSYRGSLNVDDEGTPTRNVVLIEKGRLVGYLHDRLSARILKLPMNGHARRDSFSSVPIPRMNNTILGRGETPPEEILASVRKGFYAETYQGGMVQGTGKFTFSVNLGYLVEDGKLTRPVKNATLIGTNVQILKEVELVGNDMAFFLGTCGKGGQWQPVTAGTPTVKIRQMTVGGRA
ncbi:MAG: TldD/PmbA family protein [Acidobacteriota bacterium]